MHQFTTENTKNGHTNMKSQSFVVRRHIQETVVLNYMIYNISGTPDISVYEVMRIKIQNAVDNKDAN